MVEPPEAPAGGVAEPPEAPAEAPEALRWGGRERPSGGLGSAEAASAGGSEPSDGVRWNWPRGSPRPGAATGEVLTSSSGRQGPPRWSPPGAISARPCCSGRAAPPDPAAGGVGIGSPSRGSGRLLPGTQV
ncbi:hypothetical protein [Streptomyces profundus]|uniref:hypothetical protein n=1 Tax=Streptomyces profundus TaxID=2867410 RepID=UPI001D16504C|nr:hypothetical protein [Streptomyces sp. MA3_2.13]